MAIGTDRVQLQKQESTSGGGKDSDVGVYGSSRPIKPQEDAIESAGIYLQDEVDRDETVGVYRDGGEAHMFDTAVDDGAKLWELMSFHRVPADKSYVIRDDFDHVVEDMLIEDGGTLEVENGGRLICL